MILGGNGTEEQLQQKKIITAELMDLIGNEEAFYRQKSRMNWLQEGDNNTQFFHKMVSAKQRSQGLTMLKDDQGNVYQSLKEISELAVRYFQGLFGQKNPEVMDCSHEFLDELWTKKLDNEVAVKLVEGVTDSEIREALMSIQYDKALGPNGYSSCFFKGGSGIRQGDPLSPYLFVMVMSVQSRLLNEAGKAEVFQYHPKCKRVELSHLCFAKDLVIFTHGDKGSIMGIKRLLAVFYFLSGLKLNSGKSELFVAGLRDEELQDILQGTGFRKGKLPVRYLGFY